MKLMIATESDSKTLLPCLALVPHTCDPPSPAVPAEYVTPFFSWIIPGLAMRFDRILADSGAI
jgi:hypothetical protein